MHARLLISALLFIALLLPGRDMWNFPLIAKAFDFLHFPSFFLFGFLLSPYVPIKRLAIALIVISALIEPIQPLFDRSADIVDFLLGTWGVLSWYLYQSYNRYIKNTALTSIAVFILTASMILYPLVNSLFYQDQCGDFDLRRSTFGWRNIDNSYNNPVELFQLKKQQKWILKGSVLNYPWSGASFDWALPYHYNDTSLLSFSFFSERSDFEIDIKLTSIAGESFIVSKNISKIGWNNIRIPLIKYSPLKSEYLESISIYYNNEVGLDWYYLDKIVIQQY